MAKKETSTELQIVRIDTETLHVHILGTSPLIMARMSEKAKYELLAGSRRKTAVEKASAMKHDPIEEYRASPYRMPNQSAKSLLGFPSSAFKAAMETAALETPGAKKAQIGRLVSVPWLNTEIYGLPMLFMAVVRSADMNKTPDIRTRAILPEWACRLSVTYVTPQLRAVHVGNLLATAGIVSGIGDWRQEKGAGSFGSFRIVDQDDADWNRIVSSQGRSAQEAAMESPEYYDNETREMMSWYNAERARRGFKVAA